MKRYMHVQIIAYYMSMNLKMHLHVLLVELQDGRLIQQELKREKEFQQKSCGIFHPSHVSIECLNPPNLQKISPGMNKKEILMGK